MLKRVLAEPLVHFLALAIVIFAAYRVLTPSGAAPRDDSIVVARPRIEQLAAVFAKTWQRPPSPAELKGLIDDYVKEEIYVREALALGLDRDDTVIRRRLQQKMEFLNDADADALTPSDAELAAYLEAHADEFRVAPTTTFQQVFLNPDRDGSDDAAAVLARLQSEPELDLAALGDASLLPPGMETADAAAIGQVFGSDFAEAVGRQAPGPWSGPVRSGYGMHLVRVTTHGAGRLPPLGEVREAVMREWSNARRQDLEVARLAELLGRYHVSIETGTGAAAAP